MEPGDIQAEVTRAKADLITAQKNVSAAGGSDDEKHRERMGEWHDKARKHFDHVSLQAVQHEKAMCDAEKGQIEAEMHASEQRMEELKGRIKDVDMKKSKIEARHKKMEDDIKAEEKASEDAKREAAKGVAKDPEADRKADLKASHEPAKK